jgi:hypothetical protein
MEPYADSLFKENPFGIKRIIKCSVVAVLQAKVDKRDLHLIQPISRVLKKNDIHELILTDEREARPGQIVNRIAYLAFIEISTGGIIVVNDEVYWNNNLLGMVAGFDDTHMPNHQNIILYSPKRSTGKELHIQVEDQILVQSRKKSSSIMKEIKE